MISAQCNEIKNIGPALASGLPAECGLGQLWLRWCAEARSRQLARPGVKFGLKRLKGCNAGESEAFTGNMDFSFDGFLHRNKLFACSANPKSRARMYYAIGIKNRG